MNEGVLTLSGTATLAQYQAALDSVAFSSTSLNPTNYGADFMRAINWQVNDGTLQSAIVSSSVTVIGVDQAPVLAGAENMSRPIPREASPSRSTIRWRSAIRTIKNLAWATVTITGNFQTGDQLNPGEPEWDWLVIRRNPRCPDPDRRGDPRAISGRARQRDLLDRQRRRGFAHNRLAGRRWDAEFERRVQHGEHCRPPILAGAGVAANWVQAIPPATTSTSVALDPSLTVADANSQTLAGATVAITGGLRSGDQLIFAPANGVSGSYNGSTGVLTLSGTASLAAYQAALELDHIQLDQYEPDSEWRRIRREPSPGRRRMER